MLSLLPESSWSNFLNVKHWRITQLPLSNKSSKRDSNQERVTSELFVTIFHLHCLLKERSKFLYSVQKTIPVSTQYWESQLYICGVLSQLINFLYIYRTKKKNQTTQAPVERNPPLSFSGINHLWNSNSFNIPFSFRYHLTNSCEVL